MQPIPELPATAELLGADGVREKLQVIDMSVGGLALARELVARTLEIGSNLALRLTLDHYGVHEVRATVRWTAATQIGVEYVQPPPAAFTAIQRYVAELLERGAPS